MVQQGDVEGMIDYMSEKGQKVPLMFQTFLKLTLRHTK